MTKAEFASTGFTQAHLAGVRHAASAMPSTLVAEVRRLLGAGEPFVYAYYDGIDKVAHEYGLGEHYDAELAAADRLVADLVAALPARRRARGHRRPRPGRRRRQRRRRSPPRSLAHVRCSRARAGSAGCTPARAAADAAGRRGRGTTATWPGCVAREQVVDEGWFGPEAGDRGRRPASATWPSWPGTPSAFDDPADTGPFALHRPPRLADPAEMLRPAAGGSREA